MAAPLALDIAPHDDLPGWRRGEEALDSLAYIDGFTEQEKRAVELLIVEEVRPLSPYRSALLKHGSIKQSSVDTEMLGSAAAEAKHEEAPGLPQGDATHGQLQVGGRPSHILAHPGRLADTNQ